MLLPDREKPPTAEEENETCSLTDYDKDMWKYLFKVKQKWVTKKASP